MKTTARSVWAPTLLSVVAACGGNTSVDDSGGRDASLDVRSTDGRGGSALATTTGASGSTTGMGGGGGASGSTTGTGGVGTGGSTAGSAGSLGTGGSIVDASRDGNDGSTAGSGGGGAGGAAGASAAGAGGSGTGGSGGTTAGTGGVGTGGSSAGSSGTAGAGGFGSGDASPDIVDSGVRTNPVCGGITCGVGQDCCLLNAKCFDLTDRVACPKPPDPVDGKGCGSSSDCLAGEYCESVNYALCSGPGYCQSQSNCPGSSDLTFCGCDGVTYPNRQIACAAGARIGSQYGAPCGTALPPLSDGGKPITQCGLDSQCASGHKCCAITGQCYDPATQGGICTPPPTGTRAPCLVDLDCYPDEYCAGASCSGPGGCKGAGGNCNGELSPVCACNGKNYMNASCADISGVRVRHNGYCTDADAP